jgi:hypothetical protein
LPELIWLVVVMGDWLPRSLHSGDGLLFVRGIGIYYETARFYWGFWKNNRGGNSSRDLAALASSCSVPYRDRGGYRPIRAPRPAGR